MTNMANLGGGTFHPMTARIVEGSYYIVTKRENLQGTHYLNSPALRVEDNQRATSLVQKELKRQGSAHAAGTTGKGGEGMRKP